MYTVKRGSSSLILNFNILITEWDFFQSNQHVELIAGSKKDSSTQLYWLHHWMICRDTLKSAGKSFSFNIRESTVANFSPKYTHAKFFPFLQACIRGTLNFNLSQVIRVLYSYIEKFFTNNAIRWQSRISYE